MYIRGIVINPVNKQLILARDNTSKRTEIYDINSTTILNGIIGYSDLSYPNIDELQKCYDRNDSGLVENLSGFPRAHVNVSSDYLRKGYGTALYAATTLTAINNKSRPDYENTGISSSAFYRSEAASKWWKQAVSMNVAEEKAVSVNFCNERRINNSYFPKSLKSKIMDFIADDSNISKDMINNFFIQYSTASLKEELFYHQVLRTSSAINACWVGLHTTKNGIAFLDQLDKTNTLLCNLYTFIYADWRYVENENKITLFNLLKSLASYTYTNQQIQELERRIFGK